MGYATRIFLREVPVRNVLVLGLVILAACADSNPVTGSSAGGESAGGSNTGAGGESSSGAGGLGGSSTCDEDPCKLIAPQCGCGADEACSISGSGSRQCVLAGPVAAGFECDAQNYCEPGSVCIGFDGGPTICAQFCAGDDECEAPGGKCAVTINGFPDDPVCSENCNLITNVGCSVGGTSCQYDVTGAIPFTACRASGAKQQGDSCSLTSECAPKHLCAGEGANECRMWCDFALPDCPANTVCSAAEVAPGTPLIIGTVTYGTCVPT
jgi:hypothetical protein